MLQFFPSPSLLDRGFGAMSSRKPSLTFHIWVMCPPFAPKAACLKVLIPCILPGSPRHLREPRLSSLSSQCLDLEFRL